MPTDTTDQLDRELGSERAAVNSVWRSQLEGNASAGLKRHAKRNLRKTRLEGLVAGAAATGAREQDARVTGLKSK